MPWKATMPGVIATDRPTMLRAAEAPAAASAAREGGSLRGWTHEGMDGWTDEGMNETTRAG